MGYKRGSGGPGAAIIEERARLKEENARLEQKVIRLERRAGHLLEALEIQKAMGGGGGRSPDALEEWLHAVYRHLVKSQGRVACVDLPTPPGWTGEAYEGGE